MLLSAGHLKTSLAADTTPTVTELNPKATNVSRYKKFEADFKISKTYEPGSMLPYYFYDATDTPASDPGRLSPAIYGVDGITVDAIVKSPSGKTTLKSRGSPSPTRFYPQNDRSFVCLSPFFAHHGRITGQTYGGYSRIETMDPGGVFHIFPDCGGLHSDSSKPS